VKLLREEDRFWGKRPHSDTGEGGLVERDEARCGSGLMITMIGLCNSRGGSTVCGEESSFSSRL
jgi:hypothetical protein